MKDSPKHNSKVADILQKIQGTLQKEEQLDERFGQRSDMEASRFVGGEPPQRQDPREGRQDQLPFLGGMFVKCIFILFYK